MNKKAAFDQIVWAVIMLVVLGFGVKIAWDYTSEPVRYLLGMANISAFDDELVQRFNLTQNLNKDAVDSVNGLMYAINYLAYTDTYKENKEENKIDFLKKESVAKYTKQFGSVEVKPTYYDRESVFIGKDLNVEDVKIELAIGILNCRFIFWDKDNENTRCYTFSFDSDYPQENLKQLDNVITTDFSNFLEKNRKNICERLIKRHKQYTDDECMTTLNGLLGINRKWYNLFGLLDLNNVDTSQLPKDYFTSRVKKGENIYLCGSNKMVNDVHFHTGDVEDYCEAPKNAMAFGYKVKNFNLPQKIEKSSNPLTYTLEEWLFAYGDPEYILFYEKFPEEEAQYWEMGKYQIAFATIVGTELAFLGIDVITFGMGKLLKPIISPLKSVISRGAKIAIAPFKAAIKKLGIGTGLKKALTWSAEKILAKKITKETLEQNAATIIKKALGNNLKKLSSDLQKDSIELMKKKYLEVLESLGEEAFDKAGKLTKQGINELDEGFRNALKGTFRDTAEDRLIMNALKKELGESFDDVVYKVGKELSQEVSDLGLRTIPKEIVRINRVARRAQNLLKTIFVGDMTDEAREKALIQVLRDQEEALVRMKPSDLRAFLANQRKARDLLLDEKTGKIILGELDEEFTEAAQKETIKKLDDILNSKTVEELAPRTGLIIQSFSSRTIEGTANVLATKHGIVAMMAVAMASRIDSMAEKNYPVGTNAIGLKTPYKHTVSFEEFNTGVDYDMINMFINNRADGNIKTKIEEHKKRAKNILEKYGGPGYQGLLAEVNRYYLSLVKDRGAFDQDDQRFHLVSPCNTDVLLEISKCQCWYKEHKDEGVYKTGEQYEIVGEDDEGNRFATGVIANYSNFDGENAMLYTLDENGLAVKECHPSGIFQFDELHTPKCIKINPLVENYGEYNYCYHGISDSDQAIKWVTYGAQVGITSIGLLCGPAAPACMAGLGFVSGVGGELIRGAVDVASQWPNHD